MQLTRFDRWLREKFVYETHIYTMRPLDPPPRGVHWSALPEKPGRQFRHCYIVRNPAKFDQLVERLKQDNMMFTTRVMNRKAWYVRFLAPAHHSPTWWLFSTCCIILAVTSIGYGVHRLWANPEIRQNLIESFHILRE